MNRAISDFLRCPSAYVPFRWPANLPEESRAFYFGPDILCYGPVEDDAGVDVLRQVTQDSGNIFLPFDPDDTIDSFHREKYPLHRHGALGLVSSELWGRVYYSFRPLLPDVLRRMLQRVYLSDWRSLPFPSWPVDFSADLLIEKLLIVAMKAQQIERVPFVWFWPDGASAAAMMTHDVETASGRQFIPRLIDVDESFGIRSSFQLVPEDRYQVPRSLLGQIRSRGCEIAIHGLNHNGNLFANRNLFAKEAIRINEYVRQFNAKGFRSPCMYRNADWLEQLEISYDMSFPNVAHLEPQRGGCCTVFPYFIGDTLELPLTTVQDYGLLHILGEYSIDLWKQQIGMIISRHGLVSFITHPDYLLEDRSMKVYRSLLSYVSELGHEKQIWLALPGEINDWWRHRREMRVVLRDGNWAVEGPSCGRARLGFARVEGDRLCYSVEPGSSAPAGAEARLVARQSYGGH